uniref:UDP-glucuronosyltransferase n=2 Tax=Lygus hesperus TaxID=30085 RepID=A0A0K8SR35_LYGHE
MLVRAPPIMDWLRFALILSLGLLQVSQSAKILGFFSMTAPSHHIAIQPVLRELAAKGHQIDFYSTIPLKSPHKNIREVKLPSRMMKAQQSFRFKDFASVPHFMTSYIMYKMGMNNMEGIAETPEFVELIQSDRKYDLVIGEFYFVNEDGAALVHKFKVPGVVIHPLGDCAWVNELAGLPDNPSYMIDFKSLYTDRTMNLFQRLYNTYTTLATNLVSYYFTTFPLQSLMDRAYNYSGWETRPRLPLLVSDMALVLTNSHHSVGYSFPKAPHVKEVGGININPNKPLPKDLQTLMDSAKDGVIYFSLGSVVDMAEIMEDGAFDAFVNVFKGLKQKVLWKWKNGTDIPKIDAPNVVVSTWFPQQDILAHKNTKLFITHGGLLSMSEAVNYGVPLVGIAIFGDQPKNIVRMTTAGYGVGLKFDNLTEPAISWSINEVLTNPSYKKEILRRQALFKDRPMKPLDEAVYWIEYVLRHGNVLQPASAKLPFYQLYLLDVFAVIALAAFVGFYVLKRIIKFALSLCRKKATVSQSKKKKQ